MYNSIVKLVYNSILHFNIQFVPVYLQLLVSY